MDDIEIIVEENSEEVILESKETYIRGPQGVPGPQGSDGQSSYLHIKYSDDGITFTPPSSIVSSNVEDWESGQYSWEDGTKQDATDRIRLKELISVEPLATYVFNTNNNDSQFVIRAYDKDKKYLTSIGGITNDSSKTIPSNICYISVSISSPNYEHVITTDWISDGRIIPTICKSSNYIYGENIGKYRGELVDNNPTASTTFLDYKWVKIEGEAGKDGASGTDGKSAYEIWLENGNTGTEEDYLASLKGDTGAQGEIGVGVNEIIPQYYLSTSDTQQVDGEWSETQPEWTEDTYIWTRSKVIYTDESIKYTTPVLAEAMNQTLKNTTEINEKYTEMKTTTESITNTVSDIKEVTNNIDGSIVEIEKSIDTLEQTINGLENTLETQGGNLQGIYKIGDIFLSTSSENPAERFGGTWELISKGRTLVGVDESDTDFATVKKTGGSKTHTLTLDQIPSHNHKLSNSVGTGSGSSNGFSWGLNIADWGSHTTQNTGGSKAHNNLQPYFTCYIWCRTA